MRNVRTAMGLGCLAALAAASSVALAQGNQASGSVTYKGKSIAVKHAYVVKGPDAMTKQPIRRIVFATSDVSAAIAKCTSMTCTDGMLGEGLSVNLDPGPRFSFWMVMNDQKVQYSGTEPIGALVLTTDNAKRLAGKLAFDKTAAGGPKVDLSFDATLVKEVSVP